MKICYIRALASVNQKPLSMKRLMILLGMAALLALPSAWTSLQAQVEIRNFSGGVHPITKTVRLIWWASEDTALISFVVERSLDNMTFLPIGEVSAIQTGEDGHIYDFWDNTPAPGVNYYRLSLTFTHGQGQYSDVIKVAYGAPPIYSYPTYPSNPRPGATPFTGEPDDNTWSEAMVSDIYGRPIMALHNASEIDLTNLPMGIYVMTARYASGWRTSTFVVNRN